MNKPIIVFDIETTGLNICSDRIVELYAAKYVITDDEPSAPLYECHARAEAKPTDEIHLFFNPGFPMSAEVIKVHGITDEQVKDCPAFAEKASVVKAFFDNCLLAGHNIARFDILMLTQELDRCGLNLELEPKHDIIDTYAIEKAMHSHSLIASFKRYYHFDYAEKYGNAHGAKSDTLANFDVLAAQMAELGLPFNQEGLDAFAAVAPTQENNVDLAGMLTYNDEGKVCYNFGKNKGRPVTENPSYAMWVNGQDFHCSTKQALKDALSKPWTSTSTL